MFFVSVGASVNLRLLDPTSPAARGTLGVAAALILIGIGGKILAGWAAPWERMRRLVVGVGMIPRGEVGLIFADMGRRSGVLSDEVFGAVLLMVMATTFIAPPALKALFGAPEAARAMTDGSASKVRTLAAATAWRARQRGPVVFTNGVFDLLHPGHVELLEAARREGDALIVGLNTDASARRLAKGPARPVAAEQARARVLAGLAAVDCVVLFDEDTPLELIQRDRARRPRQRRRLLPRSYRRRRLGRGAWRPRRARPRRAGLLNHRPRGASPCPVLMAAPTTSCALSSSSAAPTRMPKARA